MGVPYEQLLQAAGYGMFVVGSDGTVTMTCAKMEELWGWSLADLSQLPTGHDVFHHSHPDGSPYPREHCPIHHALGTGSVQHVFSDAFITKDGRYVPVEYVASPISSHGRVVAAVVLTRELKQSPQLIPVPAEILTDHQVVWRSGPFGLCTWVSQGWTAFTGLSFAESLGYGYERGVHPEDRQEVRDAWAAAWPERKLYRVLYRQMNWDGSVTLMDARARPYFDSEGTFLGYIGYAQKVELVMETGGATLIGALAMTFAVGLEGWLEAAELWSMLMVVR